MATPPASRDEFEVALICSLPLEYNAVSLLFDQFWDENGDQYGRAIGDLNTYTTGRFGNFDAVLVLLQNTGQVSAASATASLRSSYPGLRLVILTGICGGVPFPDTGDEILLGDVVISKTVVQYDHGEQYPNNFVAKDTTEDILGRPNKDIRGLVTIFETDLARERLQTRAAVLLEQIQDLPAKGDRRKADTYQYPGAVNDRLFEANCRHEHRLIPQWSWMWQRGSNSSIFVGRFGSGDRVLKSGEDRDWNAKRYGILAYDMEGAGVWDELPCIIVKGVCDYADGHLGKLWQNFAAATAACVAKGLVERYTRTDKPPILHIKQQVKEMMEIKENKECIKDQHQTDPRDDKTRIQRTKGELLRDSYRWILEHADFKQWCGNPEYGLLWIKGDPGKGKTMLLCGIIDEIEKSTLPPCLSYFFCQATEPRLSSATAVLRGLIYMIIIQRPLLISHVRERYDHSGKKLFDDSNAWEALSGILKAILNDPALNDAIMIVDALDECVEGLPMLLQFVSEASCSYRAKWIVSSRNWPAIEESLHTTMQSVRLCLELNEMSVSAAVQTYIRHKVQELADKKRYDDITKDAVEQHLVINAHGTFLWVALVCQELSDPKIKKRHTLQRLKSSYPPGLDPLYQRMMDNIRESPDADICQQILATTSLLYRPNTLAELSRLIESIDSFDDDDLIDLIGSCGSFLTIRDNVVYFIHQSAKDFLVNKASDKILASGIGYQHYTIFSRSLEILSETLRRDIYGLRLPGFPIEQVCSPDPDPLASIRYACIYWASHFGDSKHLQTPSVEKGRQGEDAISKLFEERYLYWLEALSLLHETIRLWRTDTGECVRVINGPSMTSKIAFSHDSALLASASWASASCTDAIQLWRTDTGGCVKTLPVKTKHTGEITSIAFSHDSALIATGLAKGAVRINNVTTGNLVLVLKLCVDSYPLVAFTRDSTFVATATNKGRVQLWRVDTGECVQDVSMDYDDDDWSRSSKSPRNLSITDDNLRILTDFGYVTIDSTSGPTTQIPAPSLGPGFSRDQRWITWNNNNVLWIPENEKRQPPWAISESTVAVGCMSGRFFIIGFSDEELSKIYAGVNYA
ncbi:hypothetical protein TrVGV298_007395 [Trichoderma virens]|nr:hypothetical protein TrVGV298_007395 [Trichoderma virens]